jgi:hypothetical protein
MRPCERSEATCVSKSSIMELCTSAKLLVLTHGLLLRPSSAAMM